MKKLLFIAVIVGFLTMAFGSKMVSLKNGYITNASKTEILKKAGPDCKVQYDRKCNFGQPAVFFPGSITNLTDAENYCRQTSISCPATECVARISVMFGFLAGSPKADSCLPAGFRGK
jgi:hypothetical protein